MNLKPRTESYAGQKQFLRNSVGLEHKTGGATLDGALFPNNTVVKAGTAVFKGANGLFAPVAAETVETDLVAASLTAHDVKIVSAGNAIVGTIAAGHPLEDKCTGVTAAFKAATKGRLVFDI